MPPALERRLKSAGPALFSYGFRPFFLGGAIWRTTSDRLVLVLHVGYAFVPIGLALLGASILNPSLVPASAGIHAWIAGAFGTMTLAVMTRASLGHTEQLLAASPGTQAIYLFAFCGATRAHCRVHWLNGPHRVRERGLGRLSVAL